MYTSIISGTKTYVPRAPGVYVLSSLGFNDPKDEIRITGATRNKDGSLSGSLTHLIEKDVIVNGSTVRKRKITKVDWYLDVAFTSVEAVDDTGIINAFVSTSGFLNRLLQGEA
jgi:hypothetical protein